MIIKPEKGKVLTAKLINRGLPRNILTIKPYDLVDSVSAFTTEGSGLQPKRINKKKQLTQFEDIWKYPFDKPYVYAISSSPNDGKAKLLAAHIMYRSYLEYDRLKGLDEPKGRDRRAKELLHRKEPPLWHTIIGGFKDILRDRYKASHPGMLFLSNVPSNATPTKFEKLRDLLEIYGDIPRVVVITGQDPLTFFESVLKYNANAVCYMMADRQKVTQI